MQIHELNRRKKTNEDVAGPGSIFNVGKQIIKDPKSLLSNPAMGQAKQDATQSYAAKQADKLANPGMIRKALGHPAYTVGGSAATQTTPQQQLAQVQKNPAVQQMVKSLAAQWQSRGQSLAARLNTAKANTTPVTEAEQLDLPDPNTIKDPIERQLLAKVYTQQGLEMPGPKPAPPTPEVQSAASLKLNAFAKEFKNWAAPKLNALGVDLAQIMQNPQSAKPLQDLLTNISISSLADPKSDRTNKLIEDFFNLVIATNQTMVNNQGGRRVGGSSAPAAEQGANPAEVIKHYGLSIPQGQIDALGQSMRQAANGGTVIRNTGNELLNAVARLAGFQIGRS